MLLMLMLMRRKRRSEFTEHAPGSKTKLGLDIAVVRTIPDRKREKSIRSHIVISIHTHTHTHTHTHARKSYL